MASEFHGAFVLVLHSHIPYVLRHDPMEEETLFEAAAESYIPLIQCCERLISEGVSPKITVSLSTCLVDQLADPHFKQRFNEYCLTKAEWATRDRRDFEGGNAHMVWLAQRWEQFYTQTYRAFVETYHEDLVGAFRRLEEAGHIELMTCPVTHPYLPILYSDTTIRAQVKGAVQEHERHFGRKPRGIWLPECGYRPGYWWQPPFTSRHGDPPRERLPLEKIISQYGLRYFVIDQHQLDKSDVSNASKTPFETYLTGGQNGVPPVTVFTRDNGLSLQVWRHQIGYPGDGVYLDFHKRHGGGRLRYWKITDANLDMAYKDLYYPDDAERYRVPEHAGHYKWLIAQSLRNHFRDTHWPSCAVTAFDTELFGHWWFEGVQWLYYVLKWLHADPELKVRTAGEQIAEAPAHDWIHVAESSWGNQFDHSTWVNREVEWVWERVYHAEQELGHLAREFSGGRADEVLQRILRQAVREAFILMASDWPFMITNWSTRNIAERRVHEHHTDFERLAGMAWTYGHGRYVSDSEWRFLGDCEARNRLLCDVSIDWLRENG